MTFIFLVLNDYVTYVYYITGTICPSLSRTFLGRRHHMVVSGASYRHTMSHILKHASSESELFNVVKEKIRDFQSLLSDDGNTSVVTVWR